MAELEQGGGTEDMRTLGTGGGGDTEKPQGDEGGKLSLILTIKGNDVFLAGHLSLPEAAPTLPATEDNLARHLQRRLLEDFLHTAKSVPDDHGCTCELRLGSSNGLSLPIQTTLRKYTDSGWAKEELERISGKHQDLLT